MKEAVIQYKEECRRLQLIMKEAVIQYKEECRRLQEECRRLQERIKRCEGESFCTVDGCCKCCVRSKHRSGTSPFVLGMGAPLIHSQVGNFGGSWKSGVGVHPFPPSVLVEGGTPFEASFITMHGGDPITDKGKTLPTVSGTPRSSTHSKNSVGFKFSSHFSLALLILFLLGSGASIGDNSEQCPPQQFIEIGRRGVVRCADQGNVSRVYWFNDANEVLIQKENGKLDGSGYLNGELNLEPNGSLVINSVDIQHESTYRVEFLDSDLKISSYQVTVTVYVPPRPPCIVVEGCKLFHPCSLTIRRGDAITCKVNGVRPQVDLNMIADSPNDIKTIPDTEIGEDGLFYTTIRGYIDVNETTWGKNVTVTCQALGLATVGLTSDVHITGNTIGENCLPATTTISPEQDHPLTVSISTAVVLLLVSALMGGSIVFLSMRGKRCSDHNIW